MGKLGEIDRRLRTLSDISGILRVMRTLAIMETGKLSRFLPVQRQVVAGIEAAAADFLHFYPQVRPPDRKVVDALLMIGSERGFCGDFNDSLLRARDERAIYPAAAMPFLMVVGSRLSGRMQAEAVNVALPGACTVEEVRSVISRVIRELNELPLEEGGGDLRLTVLFHAVEDEVTSCTLQPFPPDLAPARRHSHPPLMNLPPAAYYSQLVPHYLFAALHEIFYQSLMAESRQRQRHIEGASRRLDQKIAELNLKKNQVRQEEIIEEIEMLMLSAGITSFL